jgi:tellurite resistance protein
MDPRFTPAEWDELTLLPFLTFTMVAAADGVIQNQEATRFVEQLRSTAFCSDPLRRELSQSILAADFMSLFATSMDRARWDERLDAARAALRRRLPEDEARAFLSHLVLSGLEIAQAAGGADGKPGQTNAEQAVLIRLAERFGVQVEDLRAERDEPRC